MKALHHGMGNHLHDEPLGDVDKPEHRVVDNLACLHSCATYLKSAKILIKSHFTKDEPQKKPFSPIPTPNQERQEWRYQPRLTMFILKTSK